MTWAFLFPAFLGMAATLQSGLNRQIAQNWGLASAVLMNALVLTTTGCLVFLGQRLYPEYFPEIFRQKGSLSGFSLWYLVPGLCGFSIVVGMPWGIQKFGALRVSLLFIAAQILTSIIWDASVEGRPVTSPRVLGTLLTLIGAIIVGLKG